MANEDEITSEETKLMLAEYEDLRTVVRLSIEYQAKIFGVGIPLLSVGIGVSQVFTINKVLQIFLILLPGFGLTLSLIWVIELARTMAMGEYLYELENDINKKFDTVVVSWENWLRAQYPTSLGNPLLIQHISQKFLLVFVMSLVLLSILSLSFAQPISFFVRIVFSIVYTISLIIISVTGWALVEHTEERTYNFDEPGVSEEIKFLSLLSQQLDNLPIIHRIVKMKTSSEDEDRLSFSEWRENIIDDE